VLGDFTSEFTPEFAKLEGGSQLFPFATAVKSLSNSVKATVREYSADGTNLALGGTLTEYAADSAGDVLYEANVLNESVIDASTGIATVTIKAASKADAKEGWYLIKCTGAAAVDVYAMSAGAFSRGTNESFEDIDGKITAAPLTITTGSAIEVTDFGIDLTGGSGSIGMTTGDTARFYVQAPHSGAWSTKFGQSAFDYPDVGAVITSSYDDGRLNTLHLFNCKVAGAAINFSEKEYAGYDISIEPNYDTDQDAVGIFTVTDMT